MDLILGIHQQNLERGSIPFFTSGVFKLNTFWKWLNIIYQLLAFNIFYKVLSGNEGQSMGFYKKIIAMYNKGMGTFLNKIMPI